MAFKRRNVAITPPFISMADVVFNLVLFFLIFAKTKDNRNIDWIPATGAGIKKSEKSAVSVTIIVDVNQKVYFNNVQVGIRDLGDLVANEFAKTNNTNRAVLLKIDQNAQSSTFEPILEAVSLAGGEVFHILKEE